jgi:hypothetical protein
MAMEGVFAHTTPILNRSGLQEEDAWGEEELGREWGEYAGANSVLYGVVGLPDPLMPGSWHWLSQHKARNTPTSFTASPDYAMTPIRTCQHLGHQQFVAARTPHNPGAPYRNPPPSTTSTLMSSPFASASASSDATQLEHDDGTHIGDSRDDGGMERYEELSARDEETMRRYEDANRLLAELAVARQQRWGETWVAVRVIMLG